jgi:3-methyladenine DNA glycosylase AlkD
MTKAEVMKELQSLGSVEVKERWGKHGAREPFFGVKVEDLKKVMKKIKNDQKVAMELYDTGNSDAMYLAGLVADGAKMTKQQLQEWVEKAYWSMISEYTVPWVASENPYGHELALEWIESKKDAIAASGWSTLAGLLAIKPDNEVDTEEARSLLERVEQTIHTASNRTRYAMNGFVIAVGGYVPSLTAKAIAAGKKIGIVEVDMGGTFCKVPFSPDYIQKMKDKGYIGKKRKTIRC